MNNAVSHMFSCCSHDHDLNILVMPSSEDFDIQLAELGFNIYRVNFQQKWDENKTRPSNHFILPEGTLHMMVQYDLFIIPNLPYDPELLSKIAQAANSKIIQVKDIAEGQEAFGIARDIEPSDEKFKDYWKDIILKHMERV